MDPKRRNDHLPALPPELWLSIFHHATHVPGTLVPDIYAHASLIGPIYTKTCSVALRETLITTRALVRVCKQWWHLAMPYLYRSVYIGRARCLPSLSSTLVRSTTGKGTLVGARPLGEYTQRLDIAIRDRAENADAEFDSLAALITCMPHLAIVSFAVTSSYAVSELPNNIMDALQYSAASLRVLDWSSTRFEPSASRIVQFLAKCTQLRILNCPRLVCVLTKQAALACSNVPTQHSHHKIHCIWHATCDAKVGRSIILAVNVPPMARSKCRSSSCVSAFKRIIFVGGGDLYAEVYGVSFCDSH
ncbi:hypothetical protein HD554DRAFT_2187978 [Boletus coccyginus]|nr:hypothetical protein HD554DRAFT_2187978 [Boletus coccyginus]